MLYLSTYLIHYILGYNRFRAALIEAEALHSDSSESSILTLSSQESQKPYEDDNSSEYSFMETRALECDEGLDPPTSPGTLGSRYDYDYETKASTTHPEKSNYSLNQSISSRKYDILKKQRKCKQQRAKVKDEKEKRLRSEDAMREVTKNHVYISQYKNSQQFDEGKNIEKRYKSDTRAQQKHEYEEDAQNSLLKCLKNQKPLITKRKNFPTTGNPSRKMECYVSKPKAKIDQPGSALLNQKPKSRQSLILERCQDMNSTLDCLRSRSNLLSDRWSHPKTIHNNNDEFADTQKQTARIFMKSNTSQKSIATTLDNTSAGDMTPFTPLTSEKKWSKFRKA